ncbi:DUF2917 domain-containing protein [Paraburkholderia tropica]|uniref:DUF2917 domain-containing protein n=1 Tax=Paraburkholderia tropica TaxID=92647 RepID=UPI002AB6EA6C|nr:DUF2917 domain-containing protein [Paraburkholderia tropica]
MNDVGPWGEVVETFEVPRGACRRVRREQGGVLGVLEGRVLMTVEGDAQDFWLEPGEALPFAPGERVWIGGWDEAVRCEVLTGVSTPVSVSGNGVLMRWWAAARWLARLGGLRPVRRPRLGAQRG